MSDKLKVLFIDDEENILSSLRRIFRNSEFSTEFTSDPKKAFSMVSEDKFAVVVSDQRMPELEGVEVLKRIREISPESVRLMLTGYADFKSAMRAVNEGNVFRFLAKPWSEADLKGAIEVALAQYSLVEENRKLNKLTKHQNEELTQFNEELEKRVDERTAEVQKLNTELKSALFATIKTIGSLNGILDPRLDNHSMRVAKITGFIAKDLNVIEPDIYEMQVAAFVHQIGAFSPQRRDLSGEERRVFEAKLGARVASMIPAVGRAAEYVLHRLERFDGAGRPDGLAGKRIPLGSRIIAVASEYDRLLYLGGMKLASPLNALEEIKIGADSKFDPAVIRSLESFVKEHLRETEKEFELSVRLVELKPGMVISRPVLTNRGEVLITRDFSLNQEILDSLWNRQMSDCQVAEIFVYKSSVVKTAA